MINKIKEIHAAQYAAQNAWNEKREQILSDAAYSSEHKKKMEADAMAVYMQDNASRSQQMISQLRAFDQAQNWTVKVDEPAFAAFLSAMNLYGNNIPRSLLDGIVDRFKCDQGTLCAISDSLKATGCQYQRIDGLLMDRDGIAAAIREVEQNYAYGTAPRLGAVASFIAHVEEVQANQNRKADMPASGGSIPAMF